MSEITLIVNGRSQTVDVHPAMPLLDVLSDDLALNGPKFGCGLAQCGACTVLVDGKPQPSCVLSISIAAKGRITTIEGLGAPQKLHPLQRHFIEQQALQCGYCGNGMIMAAKALLDRTPRPTESQIKEALNGNLCRCGSHNRIVRAVQQEVAALDASVEVGESLLKAYQAPAATTPSAESETPPTGESAATPPPAGNSAPSSASTRAPTSSVTPIPAATVCFACPSSLTISSRKKRCR